MCFHSLLRVQSVNSIKLAREVAIDPPWLTPLLLFLVTSWIRVQCRWNWFTSKLLLKQLNNLCFIRLTKKMQNKDFIQARMSFCIVVFELMRWLRLLNQCASQRLKSFSPSPFRSHYATSANSSFNYCRRWVLLMKSFRCRVCLIVVEERLKRS